MDNKKDKGIHMKTPKKSNSSSKRTTSQFWASTIYPEKKLNIIDINDALLEMHLCCILSPIHDKDIKKHKDIICEHEYTSYRDKKPHFHVMFMFPSAVGVNTYEFIKEKMMSKGIQLVGNELIINGPAMARYFCHIDNPEKAQYNTSDMLYYGGMDESILLIRTYNKTQDRLLAKRIVHDIINYKFISINDLLVFYENVDDILYYYVFDNMSKFEKMVRDNFYKELNKNKRRVSTTTNNTRLVSVK